LKFGFVLPNYGDKIASGELVKISRVCEEEGFDSVWATDHVIMPTELREPYGQLLEPFVTLSFVAAATDKVKVGTSSVVLPQRNPILVAKQAAALDVFSGGRLILGLGIGWTEKEFGHLGADFRRRASIMDESIRLMRSL
jgi:alkanesulfonate monooxygenase SsuD/methylene tetrahydromethanopterin reductase-like flavin-dependent oxidoreductase (luciferase family)